MFSSPKTLPSKFSAFYWPRLCRFQKRNGVWVFTMAVFWVYLVPGMAHKRTEMHLTPEKAALMEDHFLNNKWHLAWFDYLLIAGIFIHPGKAWMYRDIAGIDDVTDHIRRTIAGICFASFLVRTTILQSRNTEILVKKLLG